MNSKNFIPKANSGWLLKMAWRDGKSNVGKLVLFMASIILGIAAVVSIQSFGENLKDSINLQSKALMGADFKIDSDSEPNERVQAIMDSLGKPDAREINFTSMAAFPKNRAAKLVEVKALEGGFPFYGELETEPEDAARTFKEQGAALVDATVMLQLGIEVGDSIKIGESIFPIAGALISTPGSTAISSSVAPSVLIPLRFVEETGLVQIGSRVGYEYYFVAPAQMNIEQLEERISYELHLNNADIDTHSTVSGRLGNMYDYFGKYLNVVAFIALLLGCVGIGSAINIYIKGKLRAVAVLKCIGATRRQAFLIFLIQIAVIGFLGGLLGATLGLFLKQLFPLILGDFLPVDVQITFSIQVIALGLLLGIFMSVLFALYPLIGTLYISPLQALRVQSEGRNNSGRAGFLVLTGIFLSVLLFSYWLLDNWIYSFSFVAGIIVTFSILTGIATLFMKAIKKNFPSSWGFPARQSLLNLFRPQNQTVTLVLAIGVGTFLISTLYFTKDLLLAQGVIETPAGSPNMILLDVQSGQREAVASTITSEDLPVLNDIPIITLRVHSLKGTSVDELRQDTTSGINPWIGNQEFTVTYRDSLTASEVLVEGEWIHEVRDIDSVPISVSENFAEDANVSIGDRVAFDVQGVLINTIVRGIHQVDWSKMQISFPIVFPEGVLEDAPQFRIVTTKVPTEEASAHLQQELVRKFPNVTIIDLRQVLIIVEGILGKISWPINFMAFFSILTGIIVLLGAVRTSKYQRIRENVLLRTIGAKSGQILKIVALEYMYLGILGALPGVLLSLVSTQLLALYIFEAPFLPSWPPFLVLLPGIILLVLAIGIGNSFSVLKSAPLEVLRKAS